MAIKFGEPEWHVASILADFGKLIAFAPADLDYSLEDPAAIRVRAAERDNGGAEPTPVQAETLEIDADTLLARRVLSSSDNEVGGRIKDLLINVRAWCLRYFVVDSDGHRILLHASWITGVSADGSDVIVDGLPVRALLTAPEYPGVEQLTPGFEDTVYRHYTHREFFASSS